MNIRLFPPRPLASLAALLLGAAFVLQFTTARRQAHTLDLLRSENRLLDQENRLLRQQLDAERILAAAQARLSTPAAPAP